MTNGTNNVCAYLYGKSTTALVKNIFDDATTTKLHSDCVAPATKCYIPNTMASAATYFTKGYYDNEVEVTTTTSATFKLGVKCAAVSSNYWTCFRNFRLLSKGTTADTSYNAIENLSDEAPQGPIYDLAGRQVTQPTKGIYIRNGQKVRY